MSAVGDFAPRLLRITRERYDQMIDAGIFGEGDRVELLDGEIVEMAPQKSRHATAITMVADALRVAFPVGHVIRVQLPLALGAFSEPEPDVAIVRGSARDYRDAHPQTAELVVEVADATLGYDRGRKLASYARAGIAEYWIVDLAGNALEVYRRPSEDRYPDRRVLRAGERVTPLGSSTAIAIDDMLP